MARETKLAALRCPAMRLGRERDAGGCRRRGRTWIVPSVLCGIIFGLLNAWVLLVEILR
jgi:hypothetical protein